MYEWVVYNGFKPVIIATKLDKIKRSQKDKQLKLVRQGLGANSDTRIIPFSSQTKQGLEEIWALMEEIINKDSVAE
jgi:GTP-binding protein